MLEKVRQGFCSNWFHRNNENPAKTSDIEIVNSLQYFCKKVLLQYLTAWQEHCDFDQKVMKSPICKLFVSC